MKKLLLGYDGSEPAREAARSAARLATQLGAKVTVLTVGQFVTAVGTTVLPTVDENAFLPTAEDGVQIVRSLGADAEAEVVFGGPAQMLVDLAAREDYDFVVVGHRGLGGIKGLLLGSVAKGVATDAHCPVLVVRGKAPETIRSVLAAVDGSAQAQHAFEAAAVLAKTFGAQVTLLHAVDSRAVTATTQGAAVARLRLTLQQTGDVALAKASEVCKRMKVNCIEKQAEGEPAKTITHLAQSGAYDLVVVGRRGMSGLERLMLGSVSDEVLAKAGPLVLVAGERVRPQSTVPGDQGRSSAG